MKRYKLCVIEKTQHLQYRLDNELFDIEEEFNTINEAKENYQIFQDSNYLFVGIFDRVKNKFIIQIYK